MTQIAMVVGVPDLAHMELDIPGWIKEACQGLPVRVDARSDHSYSLPASSLAHALQEHGHHMRADEAARWLDEHFSDGDHVVIDKASLVLQGLVTV